MAAHSFRVAGWLLILTIAVFLSGCAHNKKAPVEKPLGPYLEDIFIIENKNTNVDAFREAMPAYLKQQDSIIKPTTQDTTIIFKASGAYFGYAFCFMEDTDKEQASDLYLKGRNYALNELKRYRIFNQAFNKPIPEFKKALPEGLDKRDIQALYLAATNWLGWINLNLDKPEAREEIPKIEAMLEYINELDSSYNNGTAHAALGVLYANRPKAEGGDPEKAKEQFELAFINSGNSLFAIQVMYAKFYATQIRDRELFKQTLEKVIQTPADYYPDKAFINEVARRKAKFLLENMDSYFKSPEVKKPEVKKNESEATPQPPSS
jgi:hypothetical protein